MKRQSSWKLLCGIGVMMSLLLIGPILAGGENTDDEYTDVERTCAICLGDDIASQYFNFCPKSKSKHGICTDCAVRGHTRHSLKVCPTCRKPWSKIATIANNAVVNQVGEWWVDMSNVALTDFPESLHLAYPQITLSYISVYAASFSGNNLRRAHFERLHEATFLEELQLSRCSLQRIPAELFKCKSLAKLDLSGNSFSSLALNHLYKIESLCDLDLSYNNLNFHPFPKHFFNKCHLSRLALTGNRVSLKVMKAISSNFRGLEELSLRNCRLTSFGLDLGLLKQLKKIDIRDNPGLDQQRCARFLFRRGFDLDDASGCWVRS